MKAMIRKIILCISALLLLAPVFAFGKKEPEGAMQFTDNKPSYGEGGGSGAANLPLPEGIEAAAEKDYLPTVAVTKKGKLKVKKVKGIASYSLKVKNEGTYNLVLKTDGEDAQDFKNKNIVVEGLLESDSSLIYVSAISLAVD